MPGEPAWILCDSRSFDRVFSGARRLSTCRSSLVRRSVRVSRSALPFQLVGAFVVVLFWCSAVMDGVVPVCTV